MVVIKSGYKISPVCNHISHTNARVGEYRKALCQIVINSCMWAVKWWVIFVFFLIICVF